MPIEFRCTQCDQLLRVPEDSAGKNARCPKCQALMTVPGQGSAPLAPMPPPFTEPSGDPPPPFATAPQMPPKPSADNPFAGGGQFGGLPGDVNPYASPAAMFPMADSAASAPLNPRPVSAEAIFSYAWQVWKNNLGLLIGIVVVVVIVNYAVAIPFSIAQMAFQANKEEEAAIAVYLFGQLVTQLVQLYLTIGQVQINLKLARRQPANFSELFGGMPLFLPVLGASMIVWIVGTLGFLLLIVPGILLLLAYWPYLYLIVDRRTGVFESFSVATTITKGNWGSGALLALMSFGIILAGCAALCIGLLFAIPLVSVMWTVAYLMMSGQLDTYPAVPAYPGYAPAPLK